MINPDLSTDERWPKGDSAGILRQVECFCRAKQIRMKITERNKNQQMELYKVRYDILHIVYPSNKI